MASAGSTCSRPTQTPTDVPARRCWRPGSRPTLPTFITAPEEQLVAALRSVPSTSRCPRILGVHLEGPFLAPSRLGTHPGSARRDPDPVLLGRLLGAGPVRLMTLAPELPGALDLVRLLHQHGVTVSCGHTDATAEQANAIFDRGVHTVGWSSGQPGLTSGLPLASRTSHWSPGCAWSCASASA
jgi:N-acetylglucosamine-6-phosphate deacetylase